MGKSRTEKLEEAGSKVGNVIKKLPGLGSTNYVLKIISFILWTLTMIFFVLPPFYGLIIAFATPKVPVFLSQDGLTKLEFGAMYGYWTFFDTAKELIGMTSGAHVAKDKIIANTITDISLNPDAYPLYTNKSKAYDLAFTSLTSDQLYQMYNDYGYAIGLNQNATWAMNLYIISTDGQYLINDLYLQYDKVNHFNISVTQSFAVTPKYGVVVGDDLIDRVLGLVAGTGSMNADIGKTILTVMGAIRNGNIELWTY